MSKLVKIEASKACQITTHYELGEDIESLLTPELTPEGYIQVLLNQKQYYECVRFLAHALPKREGVWWACLATRFTHTPDTPPLNQQTLKVTESWVRQPTEELRRNAETLANKGKFKTPDSWAAMAAFWSVGNMLDNNEQTMTAPPFLYAQAISGSVGMAAAADSEDEIQERYLRFISQGLDLASGGKGMIHKEPAILLTTAQDAAPVS
ncbi:hypothetical protein M3P05_05105 [Sansalvadorimonas sp. 2012CJ34-2]|uniref:Twin-arginine translocation pathway signal n=1 Tax=Parendozoicomonas callyspongiae TaxID=2942213 RepID=A0ABT0PD73_9GAMM|nr:hypothetical protein [Sansalvadorimonas sp. 2012CJ34-2]MCL6269322.1 hypothetical protein [Sansalvadorimonas sp. 2012CJ34-2]